MATDSQGTHALGRAHQAWRSPLLPNLWARFAAMACMVVEHAILQMPSLMHSLCALQL